MSSFQEYDHVSFAVAVHPVMRLFEEARERLGMSYVSYPSDWNSANFHIVLVEGSDNNVTTYDDKTVRDRWYVATAGSAYMAIAHVCRIATYHVHGGGVVLGFRARGFTKPENYIKHYRAVMGQSKSMLYLLDACSGEKPLAVLPNSEEAKRHVDWHPWTHVLREQGRLMPSAEGEMFFPDKQNAQNGLTDLAWFAMVYYAKASNAAIFKSEDRDVWGDAAHAALKAIKFGKDLPDPFEQKAA